MGVLNISKEFTRLITEMIGVAKLLTAIGTTILTGKRKQMQSC